MEVRHRFFAWLAAVFGGSEWAVYGAFLLIVGLPILPLAATGLFFIVYLVAFLLYVPCWAINDCWSTARSRVHPWLMRLSPKSRLLLKATAAGIAVACTLTASPRTVQRCAALLCGFALTFLWPCAVVAAVLLALSVVERHRYQFSLRTMLLAVAVLGAGMGLLPNMHLADRLLGFAFDEDTIYGDGYSAWRWYRVHRGMTKEAVLKLLGPPLKASPGSEEIWHYTTYGPSETYHRREIVFKSGVVVKKTTELYLD